MSAVRRDVALVACLLAGLAVLVGVALSLPDPPAPTAGGDDGDDLPPAPVDTPRARRHVRARDDTSAPRGPERAGGRENVEPTGNERISGAARGPDGAPLPGALVEYAPRGTERWTSLRTDTEGRFVVTGLAPGRYEVSVAAGGAAGRFHLGGRMTVRTRDAEGDIVFDLPAGVAFEGRIVDPGGMPVEDAVVSAKPYRNRRGSVSEARSDAEGRFAVIVEPGAAYSLIVDTPSAGDRTGNRFLRWFVHDVEPDGTWRDVQLEPGTHVAGVLAGPEHAGVRLEVWNMSGTRKYKLAATATTDESGRFRAGGLWEKRTYGIFLAPGDPRAEGWLLLGGPAPAGVTDLQLELVRPVPVAGRVVDARREPFRKLSFRVFDAERRVAVQGQLDEDGAFRLDRVPPGEFDLQLYMPPRAAPRRGWYTVGRVRGGDTKAFVIAEDWPRE